MSVSSPTTSGEQTLYAALELSKKSWLLVIQMPEGFSHFVTSMTAPVASGWSDSRVGLAPTGKAPPYHGAHPKRSLMTIGSRVGPW